MHGVPVAMFAEFFQFQPFLACSFIFPGKIVNPLTLGAFEFYHICLRHNKNFRPTEVLLIFFLSPRFTY
jgi:hypothetical protein